MAKLRLAFVIVALLLAEVAIRQVEPSADASASADPDADPFAGPDIIPGRIQNNPILLVYDLLASLIASILIIGICCVECLGLG